MPCNQHFKLHFTPAFRQETLRTILWLGILVLTEGCGNRITTRDVPVAVPETFSLPTGGFEMEADWWKSFGDSELNSLVDSALFYNLDLKSSWFQVAQDASNVAIIASERVPQVFLELQ